MASLQRLRQVIDEESNRTFRWAGAWAAGLALFSSLLMFVLSFFDLMHGVEVPAFWTFFCGIYSLGVYWLAGQSRIRGGLAVAVALGFTTLPSVIYLLAAALIETGPATFITGPPSYLYLFTVVLAGFVFSERIAFLTGVWGATQFLLVYLVSRPVLIQVTAPGPLMLQDITSGPIYFFKALMIVFTGGIVALLASNCKTLIHRVVSEETRVRDIDRTFGRFVSPEVKARVLAEGHDRMSERREVVVLFSDIRGFTTWSERTEPEIIVRQLNEYFDRMVVEVTARGGMVDKFIGDALMCVFGGLVTLDNPAHAAVEAGQAMRLSLAGLNAKWQAEGLQEFDNGIGIHMGEVIQGTIGSRARMEFTVIGDVVNTASRIEGLVRRLDCPLIFSHMIHEQLPESLRRQSRDFGVTQLRGREAGIHVHGLDDGAQVATETVLRERRDSAAGLNASGGNDDD